MAITLPTTAIPAQYKSPRKLILYGPPKIGKTEQLSLLPGNLIVDIESPSGTAMLDAIKVEAPSYDTITEVITALAMAYKENDSKPPYAYISLDTLDSLEGIALHKAAEMYGATNAGRKWYEKNYSGPGKIRPDGNDILSLVAEGFSPGYRWVREAMKWYVEVFTKLSGRLVMTTHVREKRLANVDDGTDIVMNDISLTGKLASIMCANADAIGYLSRDKSGDLMVSFRTGDTAVMGTRCKYLAGKKFKFSWDQIYID